MNEINIYIDKLNNNGFRSSDIPLVLKVLRQDAKNGLIELTKDDVSMFQVCMFALQQLELVSGNASSSVHSGDWRETVDDFSVLKQVIDSMEEQQLISDVSWNAGGMAIYDIPDRLLYREYVYSLIHTHLKRLY